MLQPCLIVCANLVAILSRDECPRAWPWRSSRSCICRHREPLDGILPHVCLMKDRGRLPNCLCCRRRLRESAISTSTFRLRSVSMWHDWSPADRVSPCTGGVLLNFSHPSMHDEASTVVYTFRTLTRSPFLSSTAQPYCTHHNVQYEPDQCRCYRRIANQ